MGIGMSGGGVGVGRVVKLRWGALVGFDGVCDMAAGLCGGEGGEGKLGRVEGKREGIGTGIGMVGRRGGRWTYSTCTLINASIPPPPAAAAAAVVVVFDSAAIAVVVVDVERRNRIVGTGVAVRVEKRVTRSGKVGEVREAGVRTRKSCKGGRVV